MSDKSPLFVSALELIAQATELYSQKHPRKYKFVILHLANAIELILKDRLIDKGISIYKPRSTETIGIWSVFEELNKLGISVPEKPIIELLIDDRNTIQHRFGFPDAQSVYYYLEHVVTFFRRFLAEEYSVKLAEALSLHLSKEGLEILGLVEDNFGFINELVKVSPKSATLEAYSVVERNLSDLVDNRARVRGRPYSMWSKREQVEIFKDLEEKGFLPHESFKKFQVLRVARNEAAHSPVSSEKEAHDKKWTNALQFAKELIQGFDKACEAGYRYITAGDSAEVTEISAKISDGNSQSETDSDAS